MSKGIFAGFVMFAIIIGGVGVYLILSGTNQNTDVMGAEQEQQFTLAEVARHSTQDDCWTAIDGKVYELSSFIFNHPGGREILKACGKDATAEFESRQHSGAAKAILRSLEIGELAE